MQVLSNQHGNPIAYLYQNAIIHTDTMDVMGVILGNCVYTKNANIAGKLFKDKLRDIDGGLVAHSNYEEIAQFEPAYTSKWSQAAWEIVTQVKDHGCPWVEDMDEWSGDTIEKLLDYQYHN